MKLKLFITLLLLAVMPAFAQNTGVSGVVVDADSGQPIAVPPYFSNREAAPLPARTATSASQPPIPATRH